MKMERLTKLIEQYSRWKKLKIYVDRIDYNLNTDFEAAIGNSKCLIECICKTILDEQNKLDKNHSVNKLIKETFKSLNLNGEETLQFANGMTTAFQNLAELRNKRDTSSHGQSLLTIDENDQFEQLTVYFLINSVQSIACFLIEFYELEYPRTHKPSQIKYEDNQDFNDYLDDLHGNVTIAELPYSTSEALFSVDYTAYHTKYQEYLEDLNETD